MITRIKIDGFKSLLDVELYFGPFTCIAGANAAGKSNLFDAIEFLSNLADMSILEAAKSIRSEEQRHSNINDIFFKNADHYYEYMSFEVDMLVPDTDIDDLGQTATAKATSLRYKLKLKRNDINNPSDLPVEIVEESLNAINKEDTIKNIAFEYDKNWFTSVLRGNSTSPFISTQEGKIQLHQDRRKGNVSKFAPNKMPRTLLSTVTTAEYPTVFIAKKEMRNWQMLQFEPSKLRQPNSTHEVRGANITDKGDLLPATLYRLATDTSSDNIYLQITNRLKGIVDDIKMVGINKDETRDLLTLTASFKNGSTLPAQSLSDGTLRFLALAVIQEEGRNGVICMEEPENGIHPKKITEIVSLLEEMAIDTEFTVEKDNPLRQVIINTHSPKLIRAVPAESLYLACEQEKYDKKFTTKVKYTTFSVLPKTLKVEKFKLFPMPMIEMITYLDDAVYEPLHTDLSEKLPKTDKKSRARYSYHTVQDNLNEQLSLFSIR